MQKECTNNIETCYFSCRKSAARYNDALNSRAGAADKLNVSESSLRDYETGLTPVPVDVVARMAELYGAPELRAYYCKSTCPIGKHNGWSISDEIRSISDITVSLICHVHEEKTKAAARTLLRIASDGEVTEAEREDLKQVVSTLETISKDVSDLRLLMEKRGSRYGID